MLRHIAYLATLELSRVPAVNLPVRRWARRIEPERFKEWYVSAVLAGRVDTQYLEIGVYRGESLVEIVADRRVGVDPKPLVPGDQVKPSDVIVATESDDFFENAEQYGVGPDSCDAVLVDGLHEFEQALRDVLNAARVVKPDGVVVLDDCNPRTPFAAGDAYVRGGRNGDVWKVMDIIRRTQPQWRAITIDADNGIGLIWGFSAPVREIPAEEVARTKALSYANLEADRGGILGLVQPAYIPPDFPGYGAVPTR